jgi:hypothetical protein
VLWLVTNARSVASSVIVRERSLTAPTNPIDYGWQKCGNVNIFSTIRETGGGRSGGVVSGGGRLASFQSSLGFFAAM